MSLPLTPFFVPLFPFLMTQVSPYALLSRAYPL